MTFVPGQILTAAELNALDPKQTGSLQVGANLFVTTMTAGDVWLTANAYYDGANWQRVDTSAYAYALIFQWKTSIPGEEAFGGNTGLLVFRATPASNPINSTFYTVGGWENSVIFDQFRHIVTGGFGIEVDGSGTVPYGRFVHYGPSPTRTGILTNLYIDFSGTDDNVNPSWFMGRHDDNVMIERAQAASTSLSQLWCVGNTGMVQENMANYAGSASTPGTALLGAVNNVNSVAAGVNVCLATGAPGLRQIVINTSGSTITVNPPAGTIAGASSTTIANNALRHFVAVDGTHWY